jgi:hypothetical protein
MVTQDKCSYAVTDEGKVNASFQFRRLESYDHCNKPVHKIVVLQPGVLLIAHYSCEVVKGVTGI